jgi:hypothetical protein
MRWNGMHEERTREKSTDDWIREEGRIFCSLAADFHRSREDVSYAPHAEGHAVGRMLKNAAIKTDEHSLLLVLLPFPCACIVFT